METLLIDEWLPEEASLRIEDDASVALLREQVRRSGQDWLPMLATERIALIASELGQNQLHHAAGGRMAVCRITRSGIPGLEIVAADEGNGIANPAGALLGRTSFQGSLGQGLASVRRQADEVDFDIRWGTGTCVRARVFAEGGLSRSEVGFLSQPLQTENVCGDDGAFIRMGDMLVVAAIDGLGHGDGAHEAAARAASLVRRRTDLSPPELISAANVELEGTRGVVMAVAHINMVSAEISHAVLGDIETQLADPARVQHIPGSRGAVGITRRMMHRPGVTTASGRPGDLLCMYSDGLYSQTTLADAPMLLRRHPIEIAQHLLQRFARGTDDACVLVVRC